MTRKKPENFDMQLDRSEQLDVATDDTNGGIDTALHDSADLSSLPATVSARSLAFDFSCLDSASEADILVMLAEALQRGHREAFNVLVYIGRLYELSADTRGAQIRVAEMTNYSPSTISRYLAVYKEIIKLRLIESCDDARFPLQSLDWYIAAVDASKRLGRKPLELLEEAEAKKAADPSFTVRDWKRHLAKLRPDKASTRTRLSTRRQSRRVGAATAPTLRLAPSNTPPTVDLTAAAACLPEDSSLPTIGHLMEKLLNLPENDIVASVDLSDRDGSRTVLASAMTRLNTLYQYLSAPEREPS